MIGHLPFGPARLALAALTAATSYLTLRSWSGISADPQAVLSPLLGICVVLGVSGLLLRALRLSGVVVVTLQTVLVLLVLNHLWAGSSSIVGWVPTVGSVQQSLDVLVAAGQAAQEWHTPVPAKVTEFPPLLVGVGAVLALAVEVIVGTLRKVPLGGLPLIAAFTVPVSLLGGVSALSFAWAALAFALLLAADQALRLGQWGGVATSPEDGDRSGQPIGLGSVVPPAMALGVAGVVLAVMAPLLLPSGLGLLTGFGSGGAGDGDGGPLKLSNPMLNLQRDLVQGADTPLLEVRTDDPTPSHLRLTVLDSFDGEAWTPSIRTIPPTNQATEAMPPAPGLLSTVPQSEVRTSLVALEGFDSQWLPTPYPATEVAVSGDWRFDTDTLDIVSRDTFTEAEVTSLDVRPTAESLAAAGVPPRGIVNAGTELPEDMPGFVKELAERVTAGAGSDYERVAMLQRWFREDGGFRYSTKTADGNGLEQLEVFLGTGPDSRVGYCEQFSTSMALMLRSLGIPARVSVGFLTPDPAGPQRWIYSSRDLHAWSEVYFEGAGWTLFDPTPSARVPQVPGYTTGQVPEAVESAGPTDVPTDRSPSAPATPRRDDLVVGGPQSGTGGGAGGTVLVVLLVALLVVLLAATPRVLREAGRRRRLAGHGADAVERAWSEVRATALDLDLDWDDGATLRRQAVGLLGPLRGGRAGEQRGATDTGVAVRLESLVITLERGRYSKWGVEDAEAEQAVEHAASICLRLRETASPRTRRRATWLPASLWRARRVNSQGSTGQADSAEREQILL